MVGGCGCRWVVLGGGLATTAGSKAGSPCPIQMHLILFVCGVLSMGWWSTVAIWQCRSNGAGPGRAGRSQYSLFFLCRPDIKSRRCGWDSWAFWGGHLFPPLSMFSGCMQRTHHLRAHQHRHCPHHVCPHLPTPMQAACDMTTVDFTPLPVVVIILFLQRF